MADIETRKKQLETRLAELNRRLHGIETSLDTEPNPDVEDRASEREDDEVLESLGNSGLLEIQMIGAALGRIVDGVYGECVKCGDTIAEERLDLLPYAPLCRDCAD
ncbi:MAG: TraR/DksA family transcriptional regulator [Alphaproteobacteria bacterium]|nr:TraR/DksA family transcriptional regulator [Alphaproteobacteria bacterium]